MRVHFVAILAVFFSATTLLSAHDIPLAEVRNLDCAFKKAVRFDQSATTQGSSEGPAAYIKIVATGSLNGPCDIRTTLHITAPNQTERELAISHNTGAESDIVDWSPDHDLILIASEHWTDVFSSPTITVYDIRQSIHSKVDVASLFASRGWVQCSAIVEATGFAPNGEIVVHVEPGSLQKRPKDCSSDQSYWAFDLKKHELHQLPTGFGQKRYGKVVAPEIRPCKEDPNVIASCFSMHGRAFVANGTPGLRIWRVGTDRILGVFDPENEIIPENLAKQLDFRVEVYGDFEVCPFTKSKSGAMQMVCVESASHLVVKRERF